MDYSGEQDPASTLCFGENCQPVPEIKVIIRPGSHKAG